MRPQLTQHLQMKLAIIEQYSDAEMVLGMEGNTNTSSQEESVNNLIPSEIPKEPAGPLIKKSGRQNWAN